MLILSRKLNESIIIDGKIVVKVLRIERDTVKIGIQAPTELPVHRQEVFDMIQRNKQASLNPGTESSPKAPAGQAAPNVEKGKPLSGPAVVQNTSDLSGTGSTGPSK